MVVRHDSELLHNMLSRVVSIVSPTEIEKLKSLHNKIVIHYGYDKAIVNSYLVGIVTVSVLFIIGGFILFYILSGHLKRSKTINQLSQNEVSWLSTLLDSMPSMILITDKHGKVVFTNQAYNREIDDCMCEQKTNNISECHFTKAAMNQQNASIFQFSDCGCSLANRYFQIRHQKIVHPQHGSTHYMTVIDDVSEDKQKEELLQKSNLRAMKAVEARNEFLAVVSHELRTPIAAMLGLMELLQFNLQNPQDIELLRNAIQSAQRLKTQVNEILDFSKIEASQLQIDARRHNIYEELCPTLRSYETATQLKGLKFNLDWQPSNIVEAEFDTLRVNQILANLLSNALKFTESGRIDVELEVTESALQLSINDTGCGMTKTQLESVFKPFVQANKGISRRYGGTGLGMSITKNLVELMNGHIALDSELSQGTKVSVSIPLIAHPQTFEVINQAAIDNAKAQQWAAAWQGKQVLPLPDDLEHKDNLYPDRLFELCCNNNEASALEASAMIINRKVKC
ncbi:sensory box sensor histidine kinase [Vibrio ponticus]|nr:sensory box sensor histidine kinase [Vibrio ponticus]